MVRIYTRTGDGGDTSLGDGSRISKSGPRVALYGEVDELNSWLGTCAVALADLGVPVPGISAGDFQRIQNRLFDLGAVLANPSRSEEIAALPPGDQPFGAQDLESLIDAMEAILPPLKNFILPGGSAAAATLHLARAVCRRVERRAVLLAAAEPVPSEIITYLNRLSDLLFTAARAANAAAGVADIHWTETKGDG
jgi:cob(I)alamin adenosyltransferase